MKHIEVVIKHGGNAFSMRVDTYTAALEYFDLEAGLTLELSDFRATKAGITGRCNTIEVLYEPHFWDEFLVEVAGLFGRPGDKLVLPVMGRDVIGVMRLYSGWAEPKHIGEVVGRLQAGESIEALNRTMAVMPAALEHHLVLEERGRQSLKPDAKKPKLPKLREGERELQALVYFIRQEKPGISMEEACAEACERKPEWVPGTWGDSPETNLQRQISRVWSKTKWAMGNKP
ncbi:MAG: hypothetical protein ACRBBM_11035 [Pseudomonadaceae bacterium]